MELFVHTSTKSSMTRLSPTAAAIFAALCCLWAANVAAYTFYAGGRDGWVVHPSEDYNQWSGKNRFLINDTIYFKYKKGEDSVLLVSKDDYDGCNTKSPIQRWDGGDTTFTFDRSGPFYFISGQDGHCQDGQKLVVTVLHLRWQPPVVPALPPPTKAPAASPPGVTPATPPAPAASPPPSQAPGSQPPSPLASPPSPAPGASAPSGTPAAASPTTGPALSPTGALPPGTYSPPSPQGSTAPSGSATSNGTVSPTPPKSSAWAIHPSGMMITSLVLGLIMIYAFQYRF